MSSHSKVTSSVASAFSPPNPASSCSSSNSVLNEVLVPPSSIASNATKRKRKAAVNTGKTTVLTDTDVHERLKQQELKKTEKELLKVEKRKEREEKRQRKKDEAVAKELKRKEKQQQRGERERK